MIATDHLTAAMPMRPMKIALADCSEEHEGVLTERPLAEVLEERGADLVRPAWEDVGVDWASFEVAVV